MNRIWILAGTCYAAMCVGCHPSTRVGALGYENVGFEKTVKLQVVTADGGAPISIDLNHDGKPDSYVWQLDVANDATKAYEQNALVIQQVGSLLNKLVDLGAAYVAGKSAETPMVREPSKLDRVLDEILKRLPPAPTP